MRIATFNIDPDLGGRLGGLDGIEVIRCDPALDADLPAALEDTEAALGASAAQVALIGGSDYRCLAAALACAKAVVPYAYVREDESAGGGNGGHLERLAGFVVSGSEDPADAVQRWLATLSDS